MGYQMQLQLPCVRETEWRLGGQKLRYLDWAQGVKVVFGRSIVDYSPSPVIEGSLALGLRIQMMNHKPWKRQGRERASEC